MPKLSTLNTYIKTALETVSGVSLVTTDIERFNKENDYSVLYYVLNSSDSSWLSYPHSTNADMEGRANLEIQGTVSPKYKTNIETYIRNLKANVEKAINASSDLQNNTFNIVLKSEENDIDVNNKYGVNLATYELYYYYNHLDP